VDRASTVRGGRFQQCLVAKSHNGFAPVTKRSTSQNCLTKQWTTKWPNIANVAFRIAQNHGECSYFLEF